MQPLTATGEEEAVAALRRGEGEGLEALVTLYQGPALRLALEEDIGRGDATTTATVSAGIPGRATIVARHPVVVAGLPIRHLEMVS